MVVTVFRGGSAFGLPSKQCWGHVRPCTVGHVFVIVAFHWTKCRSMFVHVNDDRDDPVGIVRQHRFFVVRPPAISLNGVPRDTQVRVVDEIFAADSDGDRGERIFSSRRGHGQHLLWRWLGNGAHDLAWRCMQPPLTRGLQHTIDEFDGRELVRTFIRHDRQGRGVCFAFATKRETKAAEPRIHACVNDPRVYATLSFYVECPSQTLVCLVCIDAIGYFFHERTRRQQVVKHNKRVNDVLG